MFPKNTHQPPHLDRTKNTMHPRHDAGIWLYEAPSLWQAHPGDHVVHGHGRSDTHCLLSEWILRFILVFIWRQILDFYSAIDRNNRVNSISGSVLGWKEGDDFGPHNELFGACLFDEIDFVIIWDWMEDADVLWSGNCWYNRWLGLVINAKSWYQLFNKSEFIFFCRISVYSST